MKNLKKIFVGAFLVSSFLVNLSFGQAAKLKPTAVKAPALPAAIDASVAIFSKTLPNGLEVIVYPDSSVPTCGLPIIYVDMYRFMSARETAFRFFW